MNKQTETFLASLSNSAKTGKLISPHLWLWYNDTHELAVWISQNCVDVFVPKKKTHYVIKTPNVWFYMSTNHKLQHVDYIKEKLRFYPKSKNFKITKIK